MLNAASYLSNDCDTSSPVQCSLGEALMRPGPSHFLLQKLVTYASASSDRGLQIGGRAIGLSRATVPFCSILLDFPEYAYTHQKAIKTRVIHHFLHGFGRACSNSSWTQLRLLRKGRPRRR